MSEINEWTFCADVCKTMQKILAENPALPFAEAKVEESGKHRAKRRDITLYGTTGEPVLAGEVRFPDAGGGQSPYSAALVDDAFEKANAKGLEYFFTWNVNQAVLWKTFAPGKSIADRDLEHFNVTSVARREEILSPGVQAEIRGFLTNLLGRFARILEGTEPIRSRPLDEKFIRVLESALEVPILQTLNAISRRYPAERGFKRDLDAWMRDAQGWLLSNDPAVVRDNVNRAAHLSCYVLVNKIVFQQALRRRFPSLRRMKIPGNIKTIQDLREFFQGVFEDAKRVSRDYETVFDGDFGDTLPFLEDALVPSWREFLEHIEGFDFGKIDYDIIGQMCERLISPEERHRYGQHYTRSEIVDLINAFTIRQPSAKVLDPACGGGTFLVRAYVLKRELSGGSLSHVDLLDQIKGIDISAYATHLSTINLATRHLIDERNYPLVARSDFFRVPRGQAIFHVPLSVHGKAKQMVPLEIGDVDAVVGNPPYVRQEELPKEYKDFLRDLLKKEAPDARLSGRSDLHCYFWPHATSFLKQGGYYGFLTSSGWLDTEYGFRLQEWVLQNFAILALFESNCEPWFTGARVTTVATLMRREPDPAIRATNLIRFVQLRKPLKEVLESFDSDPLQAARMLRDFVERQNENVADDRWRIRVVNQHELWQVGCTGGVAGVRAEISGQAGAQTSGPPSVPAGETPALREVFQGEYIGGKWGIYLRAPDIFFKLLDRCGSRLVPLRVVAEIRRGVTSGADDFFFIRDVTHDEIEKCRKGQPPDSPVVARRFRDRWGITLADTEQVRVIEAGDGSRHLVEARYLEPEVHSLMEIDSVEIDPAKLSRKILLVSEPTDRLKGTHVLKYIKWGERQRIDQRTTCATRAESRPWYDIAQERRGDIAWPMAQQYRHVIPRNTNRHVLNHNLFDLFPRETSADLLAGVLNSTFVALSKHQFGRIMGREGNLKTEVVDVRMMLVPDPRLADPETSAEIIAAFTEIRKRKTIPLTEEFELTDRQGLDDAVLKLTGYAELGERRAVLNALYAEMSRIYREIRGAEVEMQKFRRMTARRDRASPRTVAEEIWEEFDKSSIRAFPDAFLPDGEPTETINLPAGKAKVIDDLYYQGGLQVNGTVINFASQARAQFAAKVIAVGRYGPTSIPQNERFCEKALESYRRYESSMEAAFQELAEERSSDQQIQARIVRELWKLLYAYTRAR